MTFTYFINENTVRDENGINHTVYGISVSESSGRIYLAYPDVFFERQKAETLCNLCNKYKLSPIHLKDVIEDALTEQYAI